MRKYTFLFIIIFASFAIVSSQDIPKEETVQTEKKKAKIKKTSAPRIGIGMQRNIPAFGLSAKIDITEKNGVQFIWGVLDGLSAYHGRFVHYLEGKGVGSLKIHPFVFAQGGYYTLDFNDLLYIETKPGYGYGLGVGVEVYLESFTDAIRINIEIGYNQVNLLNYTFKTNVLVGGGVHYYFSL